MVVLREDSMAPMTAAMLDSEKVVTRAVCSVGSRAELLDSVRVAWKVASLVGEKAETRVCDSAAY